MVEQAEATWKAERPLGLQYIADGLGIEYGTIGAMRNRGKLPAPDGWVNDKVPWWYGSTIVAWALMPKSQTFGVDEHGNPVPGGGLVPEGTEPTWEAVQAARRGQG